MWYGFATSSSSERGLRHVFQRGTMHPFQVAASQASMMHLLCVFQAHACTAAVRRKWLTRRNLWCLRRYESALSSKEALRSTSTDGKRYTAPCIGSCRNQIEMWTGPTPSLVRRVPKAFRKEKNCQSDHFSNKLFEITYTALKAGCIMKHTSPSSLSGKKTM